MPVGGQWPPASVPSRSSIIDLVGEEGEVQSDTVVELGSGRLVEEIEAVLIGSSVGETKEVTYDLADGWKATLGGEIFQGPMHSFFGRVQKNTGAFVELKYSF